MLRQVVVNVTAPAATEQKYHGCLTHLICALVPLVGCFFCLCPVDKKLSNVEMYFGIKSCLCCFLLGYLPVICCPIDERQLSGPGVGAPTIQLMER